MLRLAKYCIVALMHSQCKNALSSVITGVVDGLKIAEVKDILADMKSKLCYFVNSAWYFELHWLDRACAALHAGYEVYVIARFDDDDLMRRLNEKGLICFDSKIKETSLNPVFFYWIVIVPLIFWIVFLQIYCIVSPLSQVLLVGYGVIYKTKTYIQLCRTWKSL